MNTPWGASQSQCKITDGVYEVSTAGHGGIIVAERVAVSLLSPAAIAKGYHWKEWYAYEEDCNWAIFAYEQPTLFAAARVRRRKTKVFDTAEKVQKIAYESLIRWNPDYLAQKLVGQYIHAEKIEREKEG